MEQELTVGYIPMSNLMTSQAEGTKPIESVEPKVVRFVSDKSDDIAQICIADFELLLERRLCVLSVTEDEKVFLIKVTSV